MKSDAEVAVRLLSLWERPHTVWGWLGLVPLLTGLFGTCPIYALLGISTARRMHRA